jgi:hypothetical protein
MSQAVLADPSLFDPEIFMRSLAPLVLAAISASASAQYHRSYDAITRGLDLVDSAVVCPDYATAQFVYGHLNQAQHFRKSLPPELVVQSIRAGTEPFEPDPAQFGCALIPAGIRVHVESDYGVPTVTGKLRGMEFRGVTLPYMLSQKP